MATITITAIGLSGVPVISPIVNIKYRLASDPDIAASYINLGDFNLQSNGNLTTPIVINSLAPDTEYIIWATQTCSNNSKTLSVTTPTNTVPVCPDRVLVFQICNENSIIDDNFDIYLNDVKIGSVDLNSNSQIGSVFIASLGTPVITSSDFACPLVGMVTYYFDPGIVVGGTNVVKMINIQDNTHGNAGTVGVRNYLLTGSNLSSPCVVADLIYAGASGSNFTLPFDYTECCPGD